MLWISNTYTSAPGQLDRKHSRALATQSSQSNNNDNAWNASVQYALLQTRRNNTVPSAHEASVAPTTAQPKLSVARESLPLSEKEKKAAAIAQKLNQRLYGRFALCSDQAFNLIREFVGDGMRKICIPSMNDSMYPILHAIPDCTRMVLRTEYLHSSKGHDNGNPTVFDAEGRRIGALTDRWALYYYDDSVTVNLGGEYITYPLKNGGTFIQKNNDDDHNRISPDGKFRANVVGSYENGSWREYCVRSEKNNKKLFSFKSKRCEFSSDSAWVLYDKSPHSFDEVMVRSLQDLSISYTFRGIKPKFTKNGKFIKTLQYEVLSSSYSVSIYSLKNGKKIVEAMRSFGTIFSSDYAWACYRKADFEDNVIVKSLTDNREYLIPNNSGLREFSVNGNLFISEHQGVIKIFSLEKGQEIAQFKGQNFRLSPSGDLLFVSTRYFVGATYSDEVYDLTQMKRILKCNGKLESFTNRYLILLDQSVKSVCIYDLLRMRCSRNQYALLNMLDKAPARYRESIEQGCKRTIFDRLQRILWDMFNNEDKVSFKDLAHRYGVEVKKLLKIFNTFSPEQQELLIKEYNITDAVRLLELARKKWPKEFVQQVIEPVEQRIIGTIKDQKQKAQKKALQDRHDQAVEKTKMQNENAHAHQHILHDAISNGQVKIEDYMSIHTINARDENFDTPLLRAILLAKNSISQNAYKEIIAKLLAFNEIRVDPHYEGHNQRVKVKLDDIDARGNTALHRAIRLGLFDVALQLIDKMCAEQMLIKVLAMKCKAVEGESVVKQEAQTPFELAQTIALDANGDKKSFDELMARMKTLQEGIRNIEKDLSNVRMQRHFRKFQEEYKAIIHAFDLHDSDEIKAIVERLLYNTTYTSLALSHDLALYKIHMQKKIKQSS